MVVVIVEVKPGIDFSGYSQWCSERGLIEPVVGLLYTQCTKVCRPFVTDLFERENRRPQQSSPLLLLEQVSCQGLGLAASLVCFERHLCD